MTLTPATEYPRRVPWHFALEESPRVPSHIKVPANCPGSVYSLEHHFWDSSPVIIFYSLALFPCPSLSVVNNRRTEKGSSPLRLHVLTPISMVVVAAVLEQPPSRPAAGNRAIKCKLAHLITYWRPRSVQTARRVQRIY